MLMSAGLPPPRMVFAHGWLTINGRKMSKTLRNTVDPLALKWEFGNDPVRYYLMRDSVFGLDGDFSHDQLVERINADLANDLGNLVSRAVGLLGKLSAGRVPERSEGGEREARLRARAVLVSREAGEHFHSFEISKGIESIWTLCSEANRFIQESQPWTMKGESSLESRRACLYAMAESVRLLAHMLAPVMPEKSRQILSQMGLEAPPMDREPDWPSEWGEIPPGLEIRSPTQLFPRIDRKAVPGIKERLGVAAGKDEIQRPDSPKAPQTAHGPTAAPTGLVTIDQFRRTELRVGIVTAAEPVKGADRLLMLTVDIGEESPRTLVAGIAKSYSPGDLLAKRIVVVANLVPAKLRGVESRGMLLAATSPDGSRVLTVDGDVPPGTRIS